MFTGIIKQVGSVASVVATPAGKRLKLWVGPLAARLEVGTSVAVDGACLTVAAVANDEADFDVVPETLSLTTLARLARGDQVNLEPALLAGQALDGHLVAGHVDGIARVERLERSGSGVVLRLAGPAELTDQMVAKGSVALAGVSLTLAEVDRGRFSVALIPTTLELTTLGKLSTGGALNVELDIIGKYVRRYLQQIAGQGAAGGLTMEKLKQAGFA